MASTKKNPSRRGRASTYTPDMADRICARLAGGETPVSVNTVEIYALSDPRGGGIRYIGKANNAQRRLKTHIRDSNRRDTPLFFGEWAYL